MTINFIKENKTLLVIFISALVLRIILFFSNSPGILDDSHDYILFSRELFNLNSEIFGVRTPVYPMFVFIIRMLFGESSLTAVMGFQLLLGYLSGFIFLRTLLLMELRKKIIILSLILYLFSPLILYDLLILTESLSVFLIVFLIYFLASWDLHGSKMYVILISLTLTLLILTRPQFALLIPVFLFCLIFFARRKDSSERNSFSYMIIIIPVVLCLGWMTLIYNANGIFNFNTLTGYNLINHTGKFIEHAPEEYNRIKEIYIDKRDEKLRTKGTSVYTIWEIREDLQQTLNVNNVELSKILTSLSIDLILNHPLEYFKSVWASVKLSLIFPDEDFRGLRNAKMLKLLIPLYQLIVNFGLLAGLIMILFGKNEKVILKLFFLIIITNLISESMLEYGANSRFFAPVYPLLYLFASIGISYIIDSYKRNETNKPANINRRA